MGGSPESYKFDCYSTASFTQLYGIMSVLEKSGQGKNWEYIVRDYPGLFSFGAGYAAEGPFRKNVETDS